ncbi:MAG: hypothetical protein EA369_02390 [Bradymonadales bacterium]|nr:MAG: hypothetical protein EA369_02390 [Bradymonadales bacterium]
MAPSKHLILLRHAHRDVSDRRLDNGLSERGIKQAHRVAQILSERVRALGLPITILTSPKLRCQETVQELGERLSIPVIIDQSLDERSESEDSDTFNQRLESWIDKLKSSQEIVVAASHGDILPELLFKLTGVHSEIGKSGWAHLSPKGSSWVIADFVQKVDEIAT